MKRFINTLNKKYTFTQIESTLIDQFIKNKNLKKINSSMIILLIIKQLVIQKY